MDISITSPHGDDEIPRAFAAASTFRADAELAATEEALDACTELHHAGWPALAVVRRRADPVGWIGWVPVIGDRWASIVLLQPGLDTRELAHPVLCWLAHAGDRLRGRHGAGALESVFTLREDRLATACAREVERHRWDVRAPAPTWSTRHDALVGGTVQALSWTAETLPHRCLRRQPGVPAPQAATA
jgi:hypothetical protein